MVTVETFNISSMERGTLCRELSLSNAAKLKFVSEAKELLERDIERALDNNQNYAIVVPGNYADPLGFIGELANGKVFQAECFLAIKDVCSDVYSVKVAPHFYNRGTSNEIMMMACYVALNEKGDKEMRSRIYRQEAPIFQRILRVGAPK